MPLKSLGEKVASEVQKHPLSFDLCIALAVLMISKLITDWSWTIAYSGLAFTVSLLFQVFRKSEVLDVNFSHLPDRVAKKVAKHDIFRTTSITQDLLTIIEKEDNLFLRVALDKVGELQTDLTKLSNMEYRAVGEEVY